MGVSIAGLLKTKYEKGNDRNEEAVDRDRVWHIVVLVPKRLLWQRNWDIWQDKVKGVVLGICYPHIG